MGCEHSRHAPPCTHGLGCIHSQAQRKAKRELEGAEHELGDAQRHRDEVETANALAQTELKTLHRELKGQGKLLDCPVPALIVLAHQQS